MVLWDHTTLSIEFTKVCPRRIYVSPPHPIGMLETGCDVHMWFDIDDIASDDPINRKPCFGIGAGVDVR